MPDWLEAYLIFSGITLPFVALSNVVSWWAFREMTRLHDRGLDLFDDAIALMDGGGDADA